MTLWSRFEITETHGSRTLAIPMMMVEGLAVYLFCFNSHFMIPNDCHIKELVALESSEKEVAMQMRKIL